MLDIFDLKVEEENLHPKFKLIKDSLSLTGEQEVLKDWVDEFIDRDNKIIKEFQTTFHSTFWEFYLFAVFKESGFKIDFTKNRPDFIIDKPKKLYIEAVVANIKQYGKKEEERKFEDILSMITPFYSQKEFHNNLDEAMIRYSNAIFSKSKKYTGYNDKKKKYIKGYIDDNDFDKTTPYIIALSGYEQINYGNNFYYGMIALLYGLYYDNLNDKYIEKTSIIKKDTNSEINLGLFLNEDMKHISAVIFSSTLTLGKLTSLAISQKKSSLKTNSVLNIKLDNEPPYYKLQLVSDANPEYLLDGLFIFHNPFAQNPIDKNLFKNINALNVFVDIDKKMISFNGNNLPLVSRLNLFAGEVFFKNSIYQISESLNPNILSIFAVVIDINDDLEVSFVNIDNNQEFTIKFEKYKLEEYNIKENDKYFIQFFIQKDKDIEFKTVEQFEIYWKMKKILSLELGADCNIIDIRKIG